MGASFQNVPEVQEQSLTFQNAFQKSVPAAEVLEYEKDGCCITGP